MSVRHQIERIRPETARSFDQQFWPVLMAICVVGSMAAGAIVTLVQGPWMWVSLLALPVAAAVSILLLSQLDDSLLRRSLQIAILGSLAVHLLILVLASLTSIFGIAVPNQQAIVANQPQKKIVVSNRTQPFIFQQTRKHETPDAKVAANKSQTTTQSPPQPLPTMEQTESESQPIAERREDQPTKPQFDKQAAKLHRSDQQRKPISSQGLVTSRASSPAAASTAQPSTSPAAAEVGRAEKPAASAVRKQQSAQASQTREPISAASQRRESSSGSVSQSRQATARIRKENSRAPKVAAPAPQSNPNQIAAESIKAESRGTRPTKNHAMATTSAKPKYEVPSNPEVSASSATSRRQPADNSAATADQPNTNQSARSSTTTTPTVTSQATPSQPPAATEVRNRTVQPKSLALSRSSNGITGSGRSKNLDRIEGGQPSPVDIASSASNRRQSDRMSPNVSLSSLQSAERVERGHQSQSQRVLRSDTSQWASHSGSSNPTDKSIQAAAAEVESSRAKATSQSAAEKGSSMLDLGPTKTVSEPTADRRSGGGMPELSDAIDRSNDPPGGRLSNRSPSVQLAETTESTAAVDAGQAREQMATPQNADADLLAIRSNNDQPDSQYPDTDKGGKAPPIESDATTSPEDQPIAGRNHGREANASAANIESARKDIEPTSGNARSRLAQSPSVNRAVEFGFSGDGKSQEADAPDAILQASPSEFVRQSADSPAASGPLGTATKMLAASIAGLPLIADDSAAGTRRESDAPDAADGTADSKSMRGENSLQPTVESQLTGQLSPQPAASNSGSAVNIATDENTGAANLERHAAPVSPSAGRALEIEAPEGAAGFADVASRRVGQNEFATSDSDQLFPGEMRFKRSESGGRPSTTSNAPVAREAFRQRNPAALAESGPSTEAAIEMGLEFLARNQLPDGSWTLGQFDHDNPMFQNQINSDTAATGLALLAFQGGGYNHREYKYARQIQSAVNWLIDNQASDGGLYIASDQASNDSARLYSHAIAALALTEAYGMTQDPSIRDATQRALDYIASTQHPSKGGWRYFDRDISPQRVRSADTSVTGWMMMALQSGRLAGLKTEQSTLDQIEAWLRVAQSPDSPSEFRYNPYAVDSPGKSRSHGKRVSITMTSVGLLMRVYSGWGPVDPRFLQGADRLLQQLPSDRDSRMRDTYYWYYATQVMKHAGGEYWEKWNRALHPLLIGTQETEGDLRGSWHPYQPVPDRWGPQGGRIYVTTMNLLSLEVHYRLLPLYEKTIQ